jgi:anti-sigma regulatory factor (Ser/Thr protein kinase)
VNGFDVVLSEAEGAAATARQAVRDGNGTLPALIRDDVLLLVSELVTNAVLYAGAGPERPVHLKLLRGPRSVVVTVVDEGPGFTLHPAPPAGNESGGWGLFLVDQIADRWGVECTTSGTRVWFKIAYEE